MKNILKLFIILAITSASIYSQNIITNSGFEFGNTPTQLGQLDYRLHIVNDNPPHLERCDDWFSPSNTTPDIYDENAQNSDVKIPQNHRGYQNTMLNGGERYAGIYNYYEIDQSQQTVITTYKEYIGQAVNIEKDKIYKISYNLSLADKPIFDMPLKNIGIYLSDDTNPITYLNGSYEGELKDNNGNYVTPFWKQQSAVTDQDNFVLVEGYIYPYKDYNYLYLGHFIDPNLNYYNEVVGEIGSHITEDWYGSHYYIDNFEIIDLGDNCDCEMFRGEYDDIYSELKVIKKCGQTENNKYCYEFILPLDPVDPNVTCDFYGYEFRVNNILLKDYFDSSTPVDLSHQLGEFCFDDSDFDANDEIHIEMKYKNILGNTICTISQSFKRDCSKDLNYEIIEESDDPCCKKIKFNKLCDDNKTIEIYDGTTLYDSHTLQSGESWDEIEFDLCDDTYQGKTFEIRLKNSGPGYVCNRFIELDCEPFDCCDGFEIIQIHDPFPPNCFNSCPVLIDIKYKDHPLCNGQDINMTLDGNQINYNGTPLSFCILSPGQTFSAVTTNIPSWMTECSDNLHIPCTLNGGGPMPKLNSNNTIDKFVEFAYVFPNPSTDEITINFNLLTKGQVKINIIDLTGKVLLFENLGTLNKGELTKTFNLENIPVGSYLLKLEYENMSVPFPIQITR